MNKNVQRTAARMERRALGLGIVSKSGQPVSVDVMMELLAAAQGYRNAHTFRAGLAKRETPVLEQEHPDESGSDFKLVEGKGC